MKLMAVFLFFIYSTSSFSKELFAMENETEVRLCNNYKDIHHCFTENIESKSDKDRLGAIVVYLNNYEKLHKLYDYNEILLNLSEMTYKRNFNALVLEASIYYQGFHVDRDVNKAVALLKKVPEGKYSAAAYGLLGKIYLYILNSNDKNNKKNELYILAKQSFYKSHLLGEESSTRALAFIMLKYGAKDDFIEAGKLLEYLASKGNKKDMDSYEKYQGYSTKILDDVD